MKKLELCIRLQLWCRLGLKILMRTITVEWHLPAEAVLTLIISRVHWKKNEKPFQFWIVYLFNNVFLQRFTSKAKFNHFGFILRKLHWHRLLWDFCMTLTTWWCLEDFLKNKIGGWASKKYLEESWWVTGIVLAMYGCDVITQKHFHFSKLSIKTFRVLSTMDLHSSEQGLLTHGRTWALFTSTTGVLTEGQTGPQECVLSLERWEYISFAFFFSSHVFCIRVGCKLIVCLNCLKECLIVLIHTCRITRICTAHAAMHSDYSEQQFLCTVRDKNGKLKYNLEEFASYVRNSK